MRTRRNGMVAGGARLVIRLCYLVFALAVAAAAVWGALSMKALLNQYSQ